MFCGGNSNKMTQPSAPATGSFSSKLRQPKYIIAIALVVIIIVSGVTAAYFLTLPKAGSPYKIVTGTSAQIRYLVFNLNKVTDVRVRQAIAYAVDRGAINSNVFYNQTTGKLTIDLWYNSDGHYGDTEPTAALVLKTSIEKTGMVIINLKSETWAQFVPDRRAGTFPLFMLGWYPDYFDSDDYVSPFLTASGAKALGSFYNNATVAGWINQEESTVNDTLRANVFGQIQNAVASSVPYVPLWQGSANIGYRSDINGVYLHPVVFKYFTMSRAGSTQLSAARAQLSCFSMSEKSETTPTGVPRRMTV